MKKNNPIRLLAIRFRKWSRKAYAMFGSIGRNVTIGCLSKAAIEASLNKQKGGQVLPLWIMEELKPNLQEEDEPSPDIIHQTILLQPLILISKDYCTGQSAKRLI